LEPTYRSKLEPNLNVPFIWRLSWGQNVQLSGEMNRIWDYEQLFRTHRA
jgi:hypothetical protein